MAEPCITMKYLFTQLNDPESVIKWCMDFGLIANSCVCDKCGQNMNLYKRNEISDKYAWRCKKNGKNSHDVRRSIRKNSVFESSNLSIGNILHITHMWCSMNLSNECMVKELEICYTTVVDWTKFCKEVCVEACMVENEKLGGPGMIIEIDGCKFEKRKCHQKRQVDGNWVFGGIERGTGKCFIQVVSEGCKEELLRVIEAHVLPESTVISDCLQKYNCSQDSSFLQLAVERLIYFKDADYSAHMNNNLGTWATIRRSLSANKLSNEKYCNLDIFEHMWRQKHKHDPDLTRAFLSAIKKVYPPFIYE